MKDHPSQWIPSGLTCREVADRASDFLDERVPMPTNMRVALHLAFCADCRAYLTQILLIREAVTRLPKIYPSPVNRLRLRRHFTAIHPSLSQTVNLFGYHHVCVSSL